MDGALICSVDPTSAPASWPVRRGLPLVLVDQAPLPGTSSVDVDDRGGARVAAQHLLDLGHRHVGALTGGLGPAPRIVPSRALGDVMGRTARERLLGWLDALGPAGARVVVANHPHGHRSAATSARLLLDVADPPSAVLCFSDAMAADLVSVAEELGGRVPDDVSVIGFDDSPLAVRKRPPLTPVRQDVDAQGRAAADALHDAIRRSRAGLPADPRRVLLPTDLVVRGTTAAHPAP